MPEYDWLYSDDFKATIEKKCIDAAKEYGLRIDNTVPTFLIVFLDKYREENVEAEKKKNIWECRTPKDAFLAIEILIEEAARIAEEKQQSVIDLQVMMKAYARKISKAWPFAAEEKLFD
jgi:hypothetical protein